MTEAATVFFPPSFKKAGSAGDDHDPAKKISAKVDYNYKVMCKDCQNPVPNLFEDYSSGDIICRDCGSVLLDRVIDMRSEWRTFANDSGNGAGEDPSRVGGPSNPLLADAEGDMFLESTVISSMDGGTGTSKDLNRIHARATNKGTLEKNLLKAFRDITSMSERIGLPRMIADRAKSIFKKVEDDKLCKGKTTEGIIAACIYIACRQERVPRTFREISSLTLVPKKDIGRCYKALAPLFIPGDMPPEYGGSSAGGATTSPTSAPTSATTSSGMATVSVQDFMARFCSHLNLNMEIQKASVLLCQKVAELTCVAGKSPISVAAAVIYMITQLYPQHKKAHKDISFVAGVSEATIKNTYKEIFPFRYEIVSPEIASKSMVDALTM